MEERISYREIIVEQIKTAILLFGEGKFVSATTLAGAAEEILGSILREKGGEPSLDRLKKAMRVINNDITDKEIANRANFSRNVYKHLIEGPSHGEFNTEETKGMKAVLPFPKWGVDLDIKDEARDMINRAIDNYWYLYQEMTETMTVYYDSQIT